MDARTSGGESSTAMASEAEAPLLPHSSFKGGQRKPLTVARETARCALLPGPASSSCNLSYHATSAQGAQTGRANVLHGDPVVLVICHNHGGQLSEPGQQPAA